MILKLKQTPGIFLTGFMGSGKTTVGRLLAERIGWQFFDLDHDIEAAEQCSIADIFAKQGEPEFRRIEAEALRWRVSRIRYGAASVVAMGGGTYAQPENRDAVKESGISVWLDCPLAIVERRVAKHGHRPLAQDMELLRRLYEERQAAYALSDYRVSVEAEDTDRTLQQIFALPVFGE
jgi:shikimate kinase